MTKEINDLKELILSIDSSHYTFNDAKSDILEQLKDLQTKADKTELNR